MWRFIRTRDRRALGRDITVAEARAFINIVRRFTALVLLGTELDANYLYVTDATQWDLFDN
jgi:hypothetical protein